MPDIEIPAAALEAARVAWLESASDYRLLDESIRAACLAMLEAWPGMERESWVDRKGNTGVDLLLPLPTEDSDDMA